MTETIADVGEFGLIDRIDRMLQDEGFLDARVSISIGDDAASFRPRQGMEMLVTCDAMVEDRHFLSNRISYFDIGRRAMAVNISDIGAMGGRPLYALISLGLKAQTIVADILAMYRGFVTELKPYQASIIGGNITKTNEAAFIDITLIGEAEPEIILRRSTAKKGDSVLVTGFPGQSVAGLNLLVSGRSSGTEAHEKVIQAYSTPTPRAKEGRALALAKCASALIDTSDGFLGDLGHICSESNVGARLYKNALPLSNDLLEAARTLNVDPYDLFLGDSDDYELIIVCPRENVGKVKSIIADVSDVPVTEIGEISEASRGIILIEPDGSQRDIAPAGWDHFAR